MMRYVNLIQTCVRRKIELISILRINCCVRSAFAYCEPSFTVVWVWPDHYEGGRSGNIGISNLFYQSYSSGSYEYSYHHLPL